MFKKNSGGTHLNIYVLNRVSPNTNMVCRESKFIDNRFIPLIDLFKNKIRPLNESTESKNINLNKSSYLGCAIINNGASVISFNTIFCRKYYLYFHVIL